MFKNKPNLDNLNTKNQNKMPKTIKYHREPFQNSVVFRLQYSIGAKFQNPVGKIMKFI